MSQPSSARTHRTPAGLRAAPRPIVSALFGVALLAAGNAVRADESALDLAARDAVRTHAMAAAVRPALPGALALSVAPTPDRGVSNDVQIGTGSESIVANIELSGSVAGNTLSVGSGAFEAGTPGPALRIEGNENFNGLYGVNTLVFNSGSAAIQNVSVNVVAPELLALALALDAPASNPASPQPR